MRGKALRGIWQYELGAGDRLHYTVTGTSEDVEIISVGPHPTSVAALQKTLIARKE